MLSLGWKAALAYVGMVTFLQFLFLPARELAHARDLDAVETPEPRLQSIERLGDVIRQLFDRGALGLTEDYRIVVSD